MCAGGCSSGVVLSFAAVNAASSGGAAPIAPATPGSSASPGFEHVRRDWRLREVKQLVHAVAAAQLEHARLVGRCLRRSITRRLVGGLGHRRPLEPGPLRRPLGRGRFASAAWHHVSGQQLPRRRVRLARTRGPIRKGTAVPTRGPAALTRPATAARPVARAVARLATAARRWAAAASRRCSAGAASQPRVGGRARRASTGARGRRT